MEELKEQWRKLTPAQRVVWQKTADNLSDGSVRTTDLDKFIKKKKTQTPRKPNTYNVFTKDAAVRLKKENPNISFQELSQKIAQQWKALSQEKKDEWKKIAQDTPAPARKKRSRSPSVNMTQKNK